MDHRDICGEDECVWFLLSDKKKEGKRFLQWAKELGCVWLNGREIEPEEGTDFFTLSLNSDGTLANVPAMAHAAKQFEGVRRVRFSDCRRKAGRRMK